MEIIFIIFIVRHSLGWSIILVTAFSEKDGHVFYVFGNEAWAGFFGKWRLFVRTP